MAPLPTLFTHFPRCYSARLGSLGVFYLDSSLYSRHRPRRIDHRDERALALSAASSDSSPCPVQVMCGRFHTESHLNHKSQGVYTKRKKKTLEKKTSKHFFFSVHFSSFFFPVRTKEFYDTAIEQLVARFMPLLVYIPYTYTNIQGKALYGWGKGRRGCCVASPFHRSEK